MMGIIFEFAGEIVEFRLDGTQLFVRSSAQGAQFADLTGIKFSKAGVLNEFPDLGNREDWKQEAIKRFRTKIASLPDEKQRISFIAQDLKRFGYIPKYIQRYGFRAERYTE